MIACVSLPLGCIMAGVIPSGASKILLSVRFFEAPDNRATDFSIDHRQPAVTTKHARNRPAR